MRLLGNSTLTNLPPLHVTRSGVVYGFIACALVCLPFADLTVETRDPWTQISRILGGFFSPAFASVDNWGNAILQTIAFAILGVSLGAAAGFLLAPHYHVKAVRAVAVGVRSIHEIFWALLLLNVTGLSVKTGVIAIALPYTGIFAKVFSEYLEEADRRPAAWLSSTTGVVSAFFFARLPMALSQVKTYLLYRYECGLRSSAVLGFIGLPTLGFQLDSFFKQGDFSEAAALLVAYYIMIATLPFWLRWRSLPLYLLASVAVLASVDMPPSPGGLLYRFLTEDIIPEPLRAGHLLSTAAWYEFLRWMADLLSSEALPGIIATIIVAQLALLLSSIVALTAFPIIMPVFTGRFGAVAGHVVLVILRTSPEYMLAFIFVQVLGPSMLPAVLALGLHNGAIIAHLLGRQATEVTKVLRPDAARGINLYSFELVPRLFGSALALILYRWEIIVRESAIVGIIGILTLGFYIDSAIAELRLDRVVFLLFITMLLTLVIDVASRRLRRAVTPRALNIAGRAAPLGR